MLDTFLEIAVEIEDIASAFENLRALGFAPRNVGDAYRHPYAVVSDGTVCVGLHTCELPSPALTFVRPELERWVRALRRRTIELDFAHLGEHEFHELGFSDPNGQPIRLVEARTFSPGLIAPTTATACGRFLEFSVATRALEPSRRFWAQLGFSVVAQGQAPHAWCRLQGAGLTLGLHEGLSFLAGPSFTAGQLAARIEYLRAKGYAIAPRAPMFTSQRGAATLTIADALKLYLVEDPRAAD